jgi:hypothetical protein
MARSCYSGTLAPESRSRWGERSEPPVAGHGRKSPGRGERCLWGFALILMMDQLMAVTDFAAFDQIDHFFRDIRSVITYAFQVTGHQNQR